MLRMTLFVSRALLTVYLYMYIFSTTVKVLDVLVKVESQALIPACAPVCLYVYKRHIEWYCTHVRDISFKCSMQFQNCLTKLSMQSCNSYVVGTRTDTPALRSRSQLELKFKDRVRCSCSIYNLLMFDVISILNGNISVKTITMCGVEEPHR